MIPWTEAVPVVNHRDAFRGVSPTLVCEIVEHPEEAVAAALEALDLAAKPETLAELQAAKQGNGKPQSNGSKSKLADLAAQLKQRAAADE